MAAEQAEQAAEQAEVSAEAKATTEDGPWLLTLDAPSYLPIMEHAVDRELREVIALITVVT